jgi:hypothetical protein
MQDIVSYFQQFVSVNSPGEITWAHAVNSQARLREVLHNPQVLMLEVDLRRSRDGEIITAHPPADSSDLSFAELLKAVATSWQGLKLDFKSPEIVAPCLELLRQSELRQPILLNADILQGAGGAWPSSFDANHFIRQCVEACPEALLSIGWTTRNDFSLSAIDTAEGIAYTSAGIEEMLELCQRHKLPQVTFPIRASHLPASQELIRRLLSQEGYTLTIWGKVDQELSLWLQEQTDPRVAFCDCFDEYGTAVRFV